MYDVVVLVSVGLLAYLVGRMDRGQSETMYDADTSAYVWECEYASVDVNANVNANANVNVYGYVNANVNGYGNIVVLPKPNSPCPPAPGKSS